MAPLEIPMPYLREAGFEYATYFRDFYFDNSMIFTFVERWREGAMAPWQPEDKKESFSIKMTWMKERM
ncbi:hypothetical protein AHAS_Ahas13G0288100 [Arachis hypogaea]